MSEALKPSISEPRPHPKSCVAVASAAVAPMVRARALHRGVLAVSACAACHRCTQRRLEGNPPCAVPLRARHLLLRHTVVLTLLVAAFAATLGCGHGLVYRAHSAAGTASLDGTACASDRDSRRCGRLCLALHLSRHERLGGGHAGDDARDISACLPAGRGRAQALRPRDAGHRSQSRGGQADDVHAR